MRPVHPSTILVDLNGVQVPLRDLCKERGVEFWPVRARMQAGQSLEEALARRNQKTVGRHFERLTVKAIEEKGAISVVQCDCGPRAVKRVRTSHLHAKSVQSCGCLHLEELSKGQAPTHVEIDGERLSMGELGVLAGRRPAAIWARMRRGMPIKEAAYGAPGRVPAFPFRASRVAVAPRVEPVHDGLPARGDEAQGTVGNAAENELDDADSRAQNLRETADLDGVRLKLADALTPQWTSAASLALAVGGATTEDVLSALRVLRMERVALSRGPGLSPTSEWCLKPVKPIVLTDRERLVLDRRHAGDTYKAIGDVIGVTVERVRQIFVRTERKLRAATPEGARRPDLRLVPAPAPAPEREIEPVMGMAAVLAFLRLQAAEDAAKLETSDGTSTALADANPIPTHDPDPDSAGPDDIEARLLVLADEVPEAEASAWDPEDDEDEEPPRDEDEPAKLPDDVPVRVSPALQADAHTLAIEAAERRRMATGFYLREPKSDEPEGESKDDDEEPQVSGEGDDGDETTSAVLKALLACLRCGLPKTKKKGAPDQATCTCTHDQRRSSRKREVRAKTESTSRLPKRQLELLGEGCPEQPGVDYFRPKTRPECKDGIRPCPYVSCGSNLYLDVMPGSGSIKVNFPDIEPDEMVVSCARDVADGGGATLEQVGAYLNITRERIRQIEAKALKKLRKKAKHLEGFLEEVENGRVGQYDRV